MYTKFSIFGYTLFQCLAVTAETHPKMTWQKCTVRVVAAMSMARLSLIPTGVSLNETICSDGKKCAENCAIEGAKYSKTYGVTTSGNALTLKFPQTHEYGTNIGSRMNLMETSSNYAMFTLMRNEFAFDVELSSIACGLNGALCFVFMDSDGGQKRFPTNKACAEYGTGYCDSQCTPDLKFVNGIASFEGWNTSSDENTVIWTLHTLLTVMSRSLALPVARAPVARACPMTFMRVPKMRRYG
ncbi:exoglucanase 1 [Colletotrichum spaethianum]|uniref:Glucanase n=1 Tax=Colletotrichum spaethianum TaxID=700344 RepID=A0AA37LBX0_9PEZI|nr:exoglucanase 1 [Colletotrichum spaethianum]GKT45806.1 exoglucanase 1 [Colletotrichum spaethianum]